MDEKRKVVRISDSDSDSDPGRDRSSDRGGMGGGDEFGNNWNSDRGKQLSGLDNR